LFYFSGRSKRRPYKKNQNEKRYCNMFFRKKIKNKSNKTRNESGLAVVENAFYLPIVIIAYFGFIVVALYITQRVVLDSAVSRAALEATAYLTDEPKIGQTHSFSGSKEKFYIDPYRNLISHGFTANYGSLGKTNFENKVRDKVREYAAFSFVVGRAGVRDIKVTTKYKNYAFFGELTVDAEQSFVLPIDLSLFGVGNLLTFNSTAKTMVFKPASLINDVDLIFDFLRFFGADVRKVSNFVSGLPGKVGNLFG